MISSDDCDGTYILELKLREASVFINSHSHISTSNYFRSLNFEILVYFSTFRIYSMRLSNKEFSLIIKSELEHIFLEQLFEFLNKI